MGFLFFAALFYSIVLNISAVQHFVPVLAMLKCFINKVGLDKVVWVFHRDHF